MPDSVLHRIYASKTPKKDLILNWAYKLERLHELNVYKWKLSHISTTIKEDLREIDMENSFSYVHETLPFKYKRPQDISLEQGELSLSDAEHRFDDINKLDPKKANKDYLGLIKRTIKVLQNTQKALERKKKPVIIQPYIPRKEFVEYATKWSYAIKRLRQVIDGREKVPPTTMHILLYCLAYATLSDTYAKFILYRKEEAKLTPKQCGKIIKGRVTKMTLLYDPKTSGQALSMGYSGQQCEECGWYRTERKLNPDVDKFRLFCYSCGSWTRLKTRKIMVRGR